MEESIQEIEVAATSWFDTVRVYMKDYQSWLPEVALYGISGFALGFLCKNFGKYIVATILVATVTIAALQYAGIVANPFQQIAAMVGLQGVSSLDELIRTKIAVIKEHPAPALAAVAGFLFGWRVG